MKAAIAGIGATRFERGSGRAELDLACEAILAACADAGVDARDVDGLVRFGVEQVREPELCAALGIDELTFLAETPSGGGGAASLVGLAALAIESGHASQVVCFRSRVRSKGASYGADPNQGGRPWAKAGQLLHGSQRWQHPFGVASPAQEVALLTRRWLHERGLADEVIGHQAVAQRDHASRNPHAIMRAPITIDDWHDARVIASPLRLVDCSLECDGAVALVVARADRARDLAQPLVEVAGYAFGSHPIHTQLADYLARSDTFTGRQDGQRGIARRLFARAGLVPADVDAAMLFDHFTPAVLWALEAYGLCAPDAVGDLVRNGGTRWPDGAMPVNTHGGSNGEAFIHGVNHLPEAVRQLRGHAVNQVPGCEVVLVNGSPTDPSGAVLLTVGR